MEKIGLIGRGFVGEAVLKGMEHTFNVAFYDKFNKGHYLHDTNTTYCCDIGQVLKFADGPIFLCLPTPMRKGGSADISIVKGVIEEINNLSKGRILIIKSTIPPGTTEYLNSTYKNLSCVFNPEFLREATHIEDFKNQDRIIIGGPHEAVSIVKQMYQHAYPEVPTTKTSSTIAEMVKYVTNCFLATKVSFANEIAQICEKLEIDYDKVIEYATKDKRLGSSHWAVPGPDGHKGFGLTCLPKDLNALINVAKNLNIDPIILNSVREKNDLVRPEKDWEKLKGRAVT